MLDRVHDRPCRRPLMPRRVDRPQRRADRVPRHPIFLAIALTAIPSERFSRRISAQSSTFNTSGMVSEGVNFFASEGDQFPTVADTADLREEDDVVASRQTVLTLKKLLARIGSSVLPHRFGRLADRCHRMFRVS